MALLLAKPVLGQEATVEIRAVDASTRLPVSALTVRVEGRDSIRGRTDTSGVFRTRLRSGAYAVLLMRVGYAPARLSTVVNGDTSIVIAMRALGVLLETVRVRGSSRVIYGVVATAELAPISGARLELLGANTEATSDSNGQFVLGTTEAESYLVRIARAGYTTRLMAVAPPKDRALELSITLDSSAARTNFDVLVEELGRRVGWRGDRSALVTSDQLKRNENAPLSEALRRAPSVVRKNLQLNGSACIFVNGVARPEWPLDAFDARDVEAIEVYVRRSELTKTLEQSWPAGARCSDVRDRTDLGPATVGGRRPSDLYIVIWTRNP